MRKDIPMANRKDNTAKAPQTSEEHLAVMTSVRRQLDEAEAACSELEQKRSSVVLSGGDIDAFHMDLFKAVEKVKTLDAALQTATKSYEAAVASEAQANLEERAEIARTKHTPALKEAWRKFHAATTAVVEASAGLNAALNEIEGVNHMVRHHGRTDLVLSLSRIRADVSQELGGETVERKRLVRMENESDEAFTLRQGNADSIGSKAAAQREPIRSQGEKALFAIQEHAFEMGAHERARNFRLVNAQNYVTQDGQMVEKITEANPGFKTKYQKVRHRDVDGPSSGYDRGMPSSAA
jgi:hypothetical protein